MSRWMCIKPCWHEKKVYRIGDVFRGEELPQGKDGKVHNFVDVEANPKFIPPVNPNQVEVKVNEKTVRIQK